MHTSYTVGITTGEYKALQHVMVDQKEWITMQSKIVQDLPPKKLQVFTLNIRLIKERRSQQSEAQQ